MGPSIGEKQAKVWVSRLLPESRVSCVFYRGTEMVGFSVLPPQKTLLPKTGAQMSCNQ